MPAATAENLEPINPTKLADAIRWSIEYLLDPKRGGGKSLPSDKELKLRYQNPQITQKLINFEVLNRFSVNSIEKIQDLEQQKIQEVLGKTGQEQEQNQSTINQAAVPKTQAKIIQFPSSKRVSALGVLAEIDTVLENHKNSISPKLTADLSPKIKELLPKLGIKNLSEEQLNKIAQEVAVETSRQTLEDAHKIQNVSQINDLVADSLTQTLITHPEIAGKIKDEPTKVFQKIWGQTKEISTSNQNDLEKAAALANLDEIAELQKPDQAVEEALTTSARDTVESQEPLGGSQLQENIKGNFKSYLSDYVKEVDTQLSKLPKGEVPSLEELQKLKDAAHTNAQETQGGKQSGTKIDYKNAADTLANSLNLAQIQPKSAPNLPVVIETIVNNPTYGKKLYLAALGHDEQTLAKSLKEKSEIIERLKSKKSLTLKEAKQLSEAKLYWAKYAQAQALKVKNPKQYQALLSILSKMGDGRAELVSQSVWQSERFLQAKMPKIFAYNERLTAGAAFGKLGFNIGGMGIGSIFSNIKGQISAASMLGMGMASTKSINKIRNQITAAIGAPIAGLMLYLMSLGQAAVTGAIIGMGTGALAGAVIPVAFLGPAGVLLWPVTVPLGIVMGGAAGALIGLGIASGSATMISMGAAGATGALIGGYIGFGVGAGIGTFLAGVCITFTAGLCAPFAPFIVIGSTAIGTAIGAAIGFVVGLATGYLIGKFLITPLMSGVKSALGGIGAGAGAGLGLLNSLYGLATGLLHTGIGAISSIGGGLLSGLSGGLSMIVNGLGFGGAATASAAAIPVLSTFGVVGVTGAMTAVIVPAAIFATIAGDEITPIITPGQNQYFSLTKSAVPDKIPNSALPSQIDYTITLEAKVNLENIQITDVLKVQKQSTSFELSPDPCTGTLPQTLQAGDPPWTCNFSVTVDINFEDSLVANTVTVKATPEGQAEFTDHSTATTIIGNPPTICAILNIEGPWSQEEKDNINSICQVLDQSPQYVSLLQRAGTITLQRVPGGTLGEGVCGTVNGGNIVRISCSMTPISFAKYVIIHELGHVLGNYNGALFNDFISTYNQEGLVPTYPFDVESADESFAEMTTEYVVSKEYNHPPRSWSGYPGGPWINPGPGWTTFQQDRPAHYDFAKSKVFGGKEY
ncbi:hypothetical protein A2870_04075 [Candidatus Curtissbacteria bacterium RIFCSPHIGHO2_01_FULL_41_11]|uniref:Uncharacterized protein n=1 Tax=Candidatus Curtissbacteria bacterium RIFCSPHIGHO2_01_FULL_41_11 TaxID=1797711 RepID=A0A1F5G6L3_9BACT|nr:MAG: hypothetical protein A2870_04075 [Candidatus Curtissbacteria bacterium RIFCSPHIGHO2_01_FULL_41_11]